MWILRDNMHTNGPKARKKKWHEKKLAKKNEIKANNFNRFSVHFDKYKTIFANKCTVY